MPDNIPENEALEQALARKHRNLRMAAVLRQDISLLGYDLLDEFAGVKALLDNMLQRHGVLENSKDAPAE